MIFKIGPKQKQRIDLYIEPIKTGEFMAQLKWIYYDNFKKSSDKYGQIEAFRDIQFRREQEEAVKKMTVHEELTLKAKIKGVEIKYFIKD